MADRPVPSSFDDAKEYQETGWQKISRKLREEPLIPLGCGLTVLALVNAWRAMRRGDHQGVQRMFRARVGAQAFTVIAMVAGGAYYGQDREKRKELIKLEAQQRAEERQAKWLRELEIRDEEDKALKESIKRRRERAEQRKAESAGRNPGSDATMASLPEPDQQGDRGTQPKPEGAGVLSSLSRVGGWFGSSKPEQSKSNISDSDKVTPPPKSSD
ncbi:hypoxia induced protein conserved region-domain-containing protein [Microdochium trichocladiopsis]|uniref:Hypoxia induced protein conserved region-domain-containing protein n=1 Tax=Microdochium trichocladiopsis TaxID=1682393 RepID=A0A9P8XUX3_9PEZI|nr:hypoxia induced protein conserved region-domain-containing protein [Microdochium trichocladiopsis]KAH7018355.1 hypoxia induced protein conserved region-domain-containing protein [Microdochium trichocladiopsis]